MWPIDLSMAERIRSSMEKKTFEGKGERRKKFCECLKIVSENKNTSEYFQHSIIFNFCFHHLTGFVGSGITNCLGPANACDSMILVGSFNIVEDSVIAVTVSTTRNRRNETMDVEEE